MRKTPVRARELAEGCTFPRPGRLIPERPEADTLDAIHLLAAWLAECWCWQARQIDYCWEDIVGLGLIDHLSRGFSHK